MHVDSVDANSAQTEAFSEPRTVDGQAVFVSPEGAGQLDASTDRAWTVHVSGTTWERLKAAIDEWRKP